MPVFPEGRLNREEYNVITQFTPHLSALRLMEDLQASEESAFVQEDVSAIIKEARARARSQATPRQCFYGRPALAQAIETVLMPCTYQHTKVPQWTNNVRLSRPWRPRPASDGAVVLRCAGD